MTREIAGGTLVRSLWYNIHDMCNGPTPLPIGVIVHCVVDTWVDGRPTFVVFWAKSGRVTLCTPYDFEVME